MLCPRFRWFDEATLAIVVAGDTQPAISIVDIADLASPVVRSSFMVDGFVFAGAANAESELIVAVTASEPPILGVRFDIENGSSFVMDLPEDIETLDDIQSLDYDSTGTHLLLITQFGATVSYRGADGLQTVTG